MVLCLAGLLGLHCSDCESLCDSSVSEESEDPDTSINKAIHDLSTSDLLASVPHESDQSLYAEVVRVRPRDYTRSLKLNDSLTRATSLSLYIRVPVRVCI